MNEVANVAPQVALALDSWHQMVAKLDLSEVESLIRPDATFRSPAFWKPYEGSAKIAHILQTAMSVFENFIYHREFATNDGYDVVLEFSARIGDLELKGIDMIGYDMDGLIARFEVMIRPKKSLELLANRMGQSLDLALLGVAP